MTNVGPGDNKSIGVNRVGLLKLMINVEKVLKLYHQVPWLDLVCFILLITELQMVVACF